MKAPGKGGAGGEWEKREKNIRFYQYATGVKYCAWRFKYIISFNLINLMR